jgi:hypothetical protein
MEADAEAQDIQAACVLAPAPAPFEGGRRRRGTRFHGSFECVPDTRRSCMHLWRAFHGPGSLRCTSRHLGDRQLSWERRIGALVRHVAWMHQKTPTRTVRHSRKLQDTHGDLLLFPL